MTKVKNLDKSMKYIILSISIIIFLIILDGILKLEELKIDRFVYDNILSNIRSDNLTIFMKIFTNFASAYTLIGICAILLLVVKNKKIPLAITANLTIITIINQIMKIIFQRPRPVGYNLIVEGGFSFPSRSFYGQCRILWIDNIFDCKKSKK